MCAKRPNTQTAIHSRNKEPSKCSHAVMTPRRNQDEPAVLLRLQSKDGNDETSDNGHRGADAGTSTGDDGRGGSSRVRASGADDGDNSGGPGAVRGDADNGGGSSGRGDVGSGGGGAVGAGDSGGLVNGDNGGVGGGLAGQADGLDTVGGAQGGGGLGGSLGGALDGAGTDGEGVGVLHDAGVALKSEGEAVEGELTEVSGNGPGVGSSGVLDTSCDGVSDSVRYKVLKSHSRSTYWQRSGEEPGCSGWHHQ